ncbi:MurR/RpiR family transcriptional regulator [Microvirga splendida]|uniref:MurR/RpiR family transcriptional regulator n=1 Tax=Microvirga splendida TaxID=2795727 RepID=A0ABS0Y759_9HYPH|nr:MurR/RpiR family transcriptional regulator [Microvirga splendida]MBJ6128143.1 MurR/RpiR family transcriptional regulator [Microvirga splendida]
MIKKAPLPNLSPDPGSDILRSISAGLASMSAGQQRIAAMILENPHWAMQANVEDLALRAGVSAPTIVRFARTVGCDGLRDLKLRLAAALAVGAPYLHRSVTPGDSTAEVVRNIVGSITSVLSDWQHQLIPADIEQAAEIMHRARRVDCFGTGATSNFLAMDMQARLFRLGITTNAFSDAHLQLVAAATQTEEDVLFAISYVGRMPTLVEAVAVGKEHGATVIALTQTNTPLAAIADIVLSIDVPHDATMRVGTDAYVVQLLMIEILMVIIGLKRGPTMINSLREIHDILLTRGVDSDDPSLLHWGWNQVLHSGKDEASEF